MKIKVINKKSILNGITYEVIDKDNNGYFILTNRGREYVLKIHAKIISKNFIQR
jgi:hypothetical protein